MVTLITVSVILFVIYKLLMVSTRKQRERMYQLQQEEKNKPKKKPKPIKIYSRGHVSNEVESLYYKPDSGYHAIGGLDPDDKKSFKMCVYDHNKKKDIGYVTDKRLFKTLEEHPEHLCYISSYEHEYYNSERENYHGEKYDTYSVNILTYVGITNEESHKIQEFSNKKVHKTKRKLNAYLREVGLFDKSK
tara:strand:- start:90 stop:659 length:570 start_codon:yes stop_codon:yes gene_type:complete